MHTDIVLENVKAAVALYVVWYNFYRVHQTLRMTPAISQSGLDENLIRNCAFD